LSQILLSFVSFVAFGVSTSLAILMRLPLTMKKLRDEVDDEFASSLHALLDSQPGNPRDRAISKLIRYYGIYRCLYQARIQVGIAAETLKEHPERGSSDKLDRINAAIPCLANALTGAFIELFLGWYYPEMTRMQAVTAAQIFDWLRVDVDELCAPERGA